MTAEQMIPCPEGVLAVPSYTPEQIEWGPVRTGGEDLRLVVDRKVGCGSLRCLQFISLSQSSGGPSHRSCILHLRSFRRLGGPYYGLK
jgi:hypothetical protein